MTCQFFKIILDVIFQCVLCSCSVLELFKRYCFSVKQKMKTERSPKINMFSLMSYDDFVCVIFFNSSVLPLSSCIVSLFNPLCPALMGCLLPKPTVPWNLTTSHCNMVHMVCVIHLWVLPSSIYAVGFAERKHGVAFQQLVVKYSTCVYVYFVSFT